MIPLHDRNPTTRVPVVTIALILANVAVFVLVQHAGTLTTQEDSTFEFEHAAIPCELVQSRPLSAGEIRNAVQGDTSACRDNQRATPFFADKNVYLAALVSMFLHGGWLHLGGNMLFLWIFGNNVEDKLGWAPYVALYVAGGAVALAAQVASDPNSLIPVIGASGAIAAVMGAYLIWFPNARVLTFVFFLLIELPAWLLLLGWLALQFFTAPTSDVAWVAHVGGFVFGAVVAVFVRNTAWWQRRNRPVYRPF